MNKKVKIGFPMEYEDDKHIIRTGLWLKEYEVEMLEKKLNEYNNLQSKIDKAIDKINQYELILGYYDSNYDEYDDTYSHEIKDELLNILKEEGEIK